MIDVVKAILRKIGLDLKDVEIRRVNMDYGKGLVIPTDDWIMVFEHRHFKIVIELNKVSSKESWISLVRYYGDDMIDLHRVESIDTTPQELYKIIEDFINR